MNPVIGTPPIQSFPATFAAAGSPFVAPQARFGMAAAAGKAAGAGAEKLGKWATMRAFGKYYVAGENKQAFKALMLQYGVPALFGLSFLVPVAGWAVGCAGIFLAPLAVRRGRELRRKLELSGTTGPFARLSDITREYEKATTYRGKEAVKSVEAARGFAPGIVSKLRDLIDQLFPDRDEIKNLQRAINSIKPGEGGRTEKLVGNALHIQFEYRNKWQGRILRSINSGIIHKTFMRVPVVKLPFTALRFLLVGALMITNRKMLQQTFRTLA